MTPDMQDAIPHSAQSITIFTDGACSGNPGPGGWCALIIARKPCGSQITKEISGGQPDTTNNRMELTAAIEALNALKRPCVVDLFTDSKYMIDGISAWILGWERNGWKNSRGKPVLNMDLWQKLRTAENRHRVTWHWVKGHNAQPENERADRIARSEIKKYDAKPSNAND